MNVTSALFNFRKALLAVLPFLEHAGISWKRPDAYDDWDSIAATLFECLVVNVLRWSLPAKEREGFRLPAYDLLLASYEGSSTLEVAHPSLPEGRWLFHAFGTKNEPLDIVEVREVTEKGLPLGRDLAICPLEGANFRLRLLQDSRPQKIFEQAELVQE